jgi:hypothetical protein
MAAKTVDTAALPVPPHAYSRTNPPEAATTETHDATAAAPTSAAPVFGSRAVSSRNTSQATKTPISAMLTTFRPSAETPPSANSRAWSRRTTEMTIAPTHGPSRIATSAPPSRWPEVPAATGKFSIWTTKMKAAASPASGIWRSERVVRTRCRTAPSPPAAVTPAPAEVARLMKPSGMCISGLPILIAKALQ